MYKVARVRIAQSNAIGLHLYNSFIIYYPINCNVVARMRAEKAYFLYTHTLSVAMQWDVCQSSYNPTSKGICRFDEEEATK